MMTGNHESTSSRRGLKAAEALERLAAKTADARLRRILRVAAGNTLDTALRQHRPPEPV
jgi:hypothetical protein